MNPVSLAAFDNAWYDPGRSSFVQALWFFIGLPLLRSSFVPVSSLRRLVLRLFGARVGRGVVIKPGVRVKYPWLLEIGDNCWIGEDCWIDNLAVVRIGINVCISQATYLCTGNHNWSDSHFGLLLNSIRICDGAWVGARALLAPGVEIGECAVVAAGSVVTRDVPPFEIHGGNPAHFLRQRQITSEPFETRLAGAVNYARPLCNDRSANNS